MKNLSGEFSVKYENGRFCLPSEWGTNINEVLQENLLLFETVPRDGDDNHVSKNIWSLGDPCNEQLYREFFLLPEKAMTIAKPSSPPWVVELPEKIICLLEVEDGDHLILVGMLDRIEIMTVKNHHQVIMNQTEMLSSE